MKKRGGRLPVQGELGGEPGSIEASEERRFNLQDLVLVLWREL